MNSRFATSAGLVWILFFYWPLGAQAKSLSREEVNHLWERYLHDERYEGIMFYDRPASPSIANLSRTKEIWVKETRRGYLFGTPGTGGGWQIGGRLEVELKIDEGIVQLYSKETSKWAPGFMFFWMPGYDPQKYPLWEFRLILRNSTNRIEYRTLSSVSFGPEDVLPKFTEKGKLIPELRGQRVPRGELAYDRDRRLLTMRVLGLYQPISVDVPLPETPFPKPDAAPQR